jgi:hypothetical protein
MAPGQWNGKNFGGGHTGDGKKQTTGHYYNNVHHRRQSHLKFKPGTTVIEKKSGKEGIVLEKVEKVPRTLIRVDINGEIKYIRTNLLHTKDRVNELLDEQTVKTKIPQHKNTKTPFEKNTGLKEFMQIKKEFREQLNRYDPVSEEGGGVSIDYSDDPRGKYYIRRKSGSDMINKFNEKNIEVMNYLYKEMNDPKKMKVREKNISRSRILDIFMLDSSCSTSNLIPDCSSKSDYYNIINKYMNEGSKENKEESGVVEEKEIKNKPIKFTEEYIRRKKWGLC